mgnify:CR=1 FL=1
MPLKPRTRTYVMKSTPPLDEIFVPCAVCGQLVDADKTASPERERIVHTTTGTVYHASDVATINKDVRPHAGKYSSCWFCHSPNWLGAQDTADLRKMTRR